MKVIIVLPFLFLSQFQCGEAVVTRSAVRRNQASSELVSADKGPGCDYSQAKGAQSSHKLKYLVACNAWKQMRAKGSSCPPPTPCECHCDCPATMATGKAVVAPPACPVYPTFVMGTPAPLPPQPVQTTPAPKQVCKLGQVARSDGSCKDIDSGVVDQVLKMVEDKRAALVKLQKKYNALHHKKCPNCPGEAAYFALRSQLIEAHKGYRANLGFLVQTLKAWEVAKARANALLNGKGGGGKGGLRDGPEFKLGEKKLRAHCEPWTVNATVKPDIDLCAVICRNEPACIGFAQDPKHGWCLWFDKEDAVPAKAGCSSCNSITATKYVKRWQGTINQELWTSIQKIHVFDKAITEALELADSVGSTSYNSFTTWWSADADNKTAKLSLKDNFVGKMGDYTNEILNILEMRKQFRTLQQSAYTFGLEDAKEDPPMPILLKLARAAPTTPKPSGFQDPKENTPKLLSWKDFPNSQDTAWAQRHPECPMGTPCVCDCKCRGPPPQNFVEPPSVPMPCPPPPPLPNAAMLTSILNR